MTYKCIIVDDEELARQLIENHLSQLSDFELLASCSSAIEAHQFLQSETVDLLFMDIEMPVLKGTAFVKNLKAEPKVIFTTAHRDYAVEGFELDAVDYILKPITFERFFKAIEKFLAIQKPLETMDSKDSIYIQINKKNLRLILNDIFFVESFKDYLKIHLAEETLMFKHSLTAFEEKLNPSFLRIHRSYIVNRDKVTAYTKNDVEIGKIELPIGEFYKKNTLEKLGKPLK
ncbi:LytTR family DNA-binding domain-containing protein [Marivirga salinae]|uniref:LytTR family DNA-binding domain-containing protein n=1 Tax=Marivirga salinarum TaxID=3059078 RepID=A0AA51NA76_9BACT|nr:LytTR family DNA-binding domain-containing protein [Marivirga sp. BDSF4-3]WMN11195.1 LytTR family DNA-binding domain-containing protein [Marivirga sp. BDSF4-3]